MRQRSFGWLGLLALAVLAFLAAPFAGPILQFEERMVLAVGDQEPGSVRLKQGLWVARQMDGEYRVFLNIDPHGFHPFEWMEGESRFRSPSLGGMNGPHDETYGIDGLCVAGPCNSRPPGELYRIRAEVKGEQLIVFPTQIVDGGIGRMPRPDIAMIWRSVQR